MTAPNGTRNGHSLTPRYPPSTPLVAAQRLSAIRQNLDGRYKPALRWDATAVELNAHVGGAPSATELRVIAAIADLEYHMGQVDERAVERGELNQHATREYLAWQNSRRRLLQQLGMAPRSGHQPRLADVLKQGAAA